MNLNVSRNRERFGYILIYLLLLVSNGYQLSVYSGIIRLLMLLGLFVLLIFCRFGRMAQMKINRLSLLIFTGAVCNIFFTALVNGQGFNQIIISVAFFLSAFMYTVVYDPDGFIEKYIKLMRFLCVFSLILYFAAKLIPQALTWLPVVSNVNGLPAYNAVFSTICINYLIRNQGIFWEPGAYQTFINLAMLFNLFAFKKDRMINLIIFGITIFTTYSTTGYIVALIILLVFVSHSLSKAEREKQRSVLGKVCAAVVLITAGLIVYNSLSDTAKFQVFGKISLYIENGRYSSTSVRIDAFTYPFRQFVERPFFGSGTDRISELALSSGYNMNTNTIVNWFAMFGFFMGIGMNLGLYGLCVRLESKTAVRILLFAAVLLSMSSEDYVRNPSILVFVFYGYHYLELKAAGLRNGAAVIEASAGLPKTNQ